MSEALGFEQLTEIPQDCVLPPLDRTTVDESSLSAEQLFWRQNGYLIMPSVLPDDRIAGYVRVREANNMPPIAGFPNSYAYMQIREIRDICLYEPVAAMMEHLIGDKLALHFDLTQWVSTERTWHQDDYLNEDHINSWYVAAWYALDDVDPASGPFEYVPTSHRWPVMRKQKIQARLNPEEATSARWPSFAEHFVTPIFDAKITESRLPVRQFLAKKGDVLIWHARLVHRGARPRKPGTPRKSIIGHFTALGKISPKDHDVEYTDELFPYIIHKYAQRF
jgi:hypothetical protein